MAASHAPGGSFWRHGSHMRLRLITSDEAFRSLRDLPTEWDLSALMRPEFGYRLLSKVTVPSEDPRFSAVQTLLDDTFLDRFTRDRKDGAVPKRLVLARLERVQNVPNWLDYREKRATLASLCNGGAPLVSVKTMCSKGVNALPDLDASVNELWLWHGTSAAAANAITTGDFNLKFVGTGAGTMYGPGVYLAEACTKSDEYTGADGSGLRPLLLCRATCGKMNYTDDVRPDVPSLMTSVQSGQFHSVLGDREKARGTYREIIVYAEDQVYPAYICWYRRDMENGAPDSVDDPPREGGETADDEAPKE